jgi:hypothetical protein
MTKLVSVVFIVACLFILSACEETITPMLEVPDQSIENGEVSITVAIDKAGWLVLHPATEAGAPDISEQLTRSYLTGAGEWIDSPIEVTVPLLIGGERTIFARLYYDDPADRQFEPSSDNSSDPAVTIESGTVQDSFTVPGIPPYIEIEQKAARKVTFTVGIDAPGWLILCPETPEGEADTSQILQRIYFTESGQSEFSVTIPGTIEAGATIYTLLYYDDPLDETFTHFSDDSTDLPVQDDDGDVIESFVVNG